MDEMKPMGTLRDVKAGRIKAPHAIRTAFGYFEFYTLNQEWWVGNGARSFSCTPDTPVFVPVSITAATVFGNDLPVFLRKQAD